MQSRMSMLSIRTGTGTSLGGVDERQVFTDIANYKGKIVAIKKFPKVTINVKDRAILMDFKYVSFITAIY